MLSNQGAFRIFAWIAFEIVKSEREQKQKRISGQFFSFSNFQTFENLETDFGINFNNCFW